MELNSGELRSRQRRLVAKARLDEAGLSTQDEYTRSRPCHVLLPLLLPFPSTLLLTFDLALCPVHRSFEVEQRRLSASFRRASGPDCRVG